MKADYRRFLVWGLKAIPLLIAAGVLYWLVTSPAEVLQANMGWAAAGFAYCGLAPFIGMFVSTGIFSGGGGRSSSNDSLLGVVFEVVCTVVFGLF